MAVAHSAPPSAPPRPTRTGPAKPDAAECLKRLRMMMLIRRFEERTYQEYTKKYPGSRDGEPRPPIGGFCHLYSGQEAIAVGISSIYQVGKDYLVNGYRDHGHSLALGMTPRAAMAEMFGKATGSSKGKGGSMHFFQAEVGNMGGHGIVGGHIPLGIGAAFSAKYKNTGGVCFTLFGDGAINQGAHNEALNMASLMKLPCIFMIENNWMAMGTQVERHSAERDLAKRGSGYNMPYFNVDANDLDTCIEVFHEAADRARRGDGPTYLSCNTFRFRGHSMSDPLKYRSKEEAEKAKLRDPIKIYSDRLRDMGIWNDSLDEQYTSEIRDIVEDSVKFAIESPEPDPSELYTDVLVETYPFPK
jgi:pyruvate dehydrogenase E1 component alpha subunit